ncbi:6034_t:CDS:2, partial [Paraglomus occultum]
SRRDQTSEQDETVGFLQGDRKFDYHAFPNVGGIGCRATTSSIEKYVTTHSFEEKPAC